MINFRAAPLPDWDNIFKFSNRLSRLASREPDNLIVQIIKQVASNFRDAIRESQTIPNSQATIILKGASIPLVDTGKLVSSIIWKKLSRNIYYAGVDPNARTKRGDSVAMIAVRQNAGYVVPVTEGVRNFMRSQDISVREDTSFFVVPARPFLTVAIERSIEDIKTIVGDGLRGWVTVLRV